MTDRYRENTVLNNKSKYNSKHSLTHTPIKQPNKKTKQNGKQASQSNQSDIRPFQSDIKFLFLIPFNPTGFNQLSPSPIILCKPESTRWLLFMAGQQG